VETPVSDVLRSRHQTVEGLKSAVLFSVGGHAATFVVLALLPAVLPEQPVQPRVVMNISLGGTPGPLTGGTQMLGGRRIDTALPSSDPQIARSVLPSPPVQPKMTLPDPKAKPRTPSKVAASANDSSGSAAGRGEAPRAGTTRVETGARGQGFGLSSGGGGGDSGIRLDSEFCCLEYIQQMRELIRRAWNDRQQSSGIVIVKYTIQRDGQITHIEVEKTSGSPILDLAAQRALSSTRLPPLPLAFQESQLTVHLTFEYERSRR
jgi:TonB family protein